jgi:MraZ protein
MDPDETVETTYYNSSYRHGVDDKRRVQVPAKWRPAKAGVELTVIMWPGSSAGTCLRVLPPQQMARLMMDIDAMPNADPTKPVLKRLIGSGSEQVTLDKAGRICLPERMASAADIKKEAMLVGSLDRFEIWSPERYDKVQLADAVMASEVLKLMG